MTLPWSPDFFAVETTVVFQGDASDLVAMATAVTLLQKLSQSALI